MPLIPFPDVPQTPGVPALPRLPGVTDVSNFALNTLQGALWRVFQVDNKWGIFNADGSALIDPKLFPGLLGVAVQTIGDSVLTFSLGGTLSTGSIDFSKETKVSDFPVEGGKFASYNKVETPAQPIVVLNFSGSESDRKKFIDTVDEAVKSTKLYNVVTPEVTYLNYAFERMGYRRNASAGGYMYTVEISLKEIRAVSAKYTISNRGNVAGAKDPGATPPVDNGKTQAQTPNTSTLKSIAVKIPALADRAIAYIQGFFQ